MITIWPGDLKASPSIPSVSQTNSFLHFSFLQITEILVNSEPPSCLIKMYNPELIRVSVNRDLTKVFSFQHRSNSMNFKVVLQEAEEGGCIASCPALPGCHSQGDDAEEAKKNIKEAIVGCLESLANERTKQ